MKEYKILFLCTGNSARSIMAEVLANHWCKPRMRAYSAGSHPTGEVHDLALTLLQRMALPTEGLRSKSWEEFAREDAPPLDFVFTVCDKAAGETCPVWPGQPITAHWGVSDPVAVQGSERERMQAFRTALRELETRIRIFNQLPLEKLDRLALKQEVDRIGRVQSGNREIV
jgi:arsenate reductase (thioredoxin)